jgi:ABC-type cobalamin/Fe3+-siderophores transport system ATPase subunit
MNPKCRDCALLKCLFERLNDQKGVVMKQKKLIESLHKQLHRQRTVTLPDQFFNPN